MRYKNIVLNDNWFYKDPGINSENTLIESMEDFQNNYPENFYFIDRFPHLVHDFDKYSQMELYYSNSGNNDSYKSEENKFLAVISKLWVYGETIVESSIHSEEDASLQLEDSQDPSYFNEFKTEDLVCVTDAKKLASVLKLALRGKIWVCFIMNDLSIIVWCNDLVCGVYFGEAAKSKPLVQNICTTEGLYLRPITE
ncbi:hypothetical protein [Paenibacillus xylaniclasticus]|uniref:hypothetical protein n=1 Tax=Paenibacillus xylaniclasticus TaxID=588083 RepID=UPI000FD78F1D|nr:MULTISPECIES: hypothetical protein [Paenibacillus]GFN31072.1 hypothetical protein PCURB6_13320 [Paenibacillus curdlanolyticus]